MSTRPRVRTATVLASTLIPLLAAAGAASAGAPAPVSSWPQLGQSAAHLGTNPGERGITLANVSGLRTAFRGHYGDNVTTTGGPAVAGGLAYVGGSDGTLAAFRTTGCGAASCEPLWVGRTTNGIHGTPAVAGDVVLAASADHFLYAFSAAGCGTGVCSPRWRGRLPDAVVSSSVTVSQGVAYVGDYSGHLSAFAVKGCGAATCAPLWTGRARAEETLGSPAVAGGFVYVPSFLSTPDLVSGRLLVFPAAGCGARVCRPSWTADLGGPGTGVTVSGGTVFAASGTLFGEGVNTDFHLMAFRAAGCGAATCLPTRAYNTGDGGVSGAPAVSGGVVYATTQASPDPNTVGVVAAYPAAGCGAARCGATWTGVNFASGFASAPAVVGGVVLVGKGPASGFPVDAGLYGFDARGCGALICPAASFLQLGDQQFYLGAPIAVAEGRIFMASNDNTDGHSNLYVLRPAG